MHRIALISDIHGNLPALQSVFSDLDHRQVDAVFCLGDLVDFTPWPNEVIDLLRSRRIPCILGNHDERIAFGYPVQPSANHTAEENAARVLGVQVTRDAISPLNRQYLADLPREIRLVFGQGATRRDLLLVHASPRDIDEHLYKDHPLDDLRDIFTDHGADILVMGHTHFPYIRHFSPAPGEPTRLALNCGSVGRSKEDSPLAVYAILAIEGNRLTAEILRIPYDVQETIAAIRASDIPSFYAEFFERRQAASTR